MAQHLAGPLVHSATSAQCRGVNRHGPSASAATFVIIIIISYHHPYQYHHLFLIVKITSHQRLLRAPSARLTSTGPYTADPKSAVSETSHTRATHGETKRIVRLKLYVVAVAELLSL